MNATRGTSLMSGRAAARYFVITKNPSDFPAHIVVRRWNVWIVGDWFGSGVRAVPDGEPMATFPFDPESEKSAVDAINAARRIFQDYGSMTCVSRAEFDDPVIVETWL